MDLPVIPIHKQPQYLLECCKLINDEWKRSETARLRSLENSCDYLPVSLILLKGKEVIGHAKLSKIPSMKEACFVESVVIKKKLRGQGYGSYLMNKVEEYCQDHLKLKFIYLSTKGQEIFYQKLGYSLCEPIPLYGAPINNSTNIFIKFHSYIKKASPPVLPKNNHSTNSQKVYMIKPIQYSQEKK